MTNVSFQQKNEFMKKNMKSCLHDLKLVNMPADMKLTMIYVLQMKFFKALLVCCVVLVSRCGVSGQFFEPNQGNEKETGGKSMIVLFSLVLTSQQLY